MSSEKKNTNPTYESLSKILTDEEIVDAYVLPSELSSEEKKEAHAEFIKLRLDQLANLTKEEILLGSIMKMKIDLINYMKIGEYKSDYSFSNQLVRYIDITGRNQKSLSEEIDLNKSTLNRIIKEKENPNTELMYRLEKHSNGILSASTWYGLLVMKMNHEIASNDAEREIQYSRVKRVVNLGKTG